jgi:hypothetical protein
MGGNVMFPAFKILLELSKWRDEEIKAGNMIKARRIHKVFVRKKKHLNFNR